MEAQLTEASTFPVQAYANSFFSQFPTDARFLQCTLQKIMPTSSIDGKTIEFNLDRYDAANVYQIQETYVEVNVSIVKSDNSLPSQNKTVGTVNNLLHSLFESVRIIINDAHISVAPGNYPFKAYIANCLTYPQGVKTCQLACQGWYSDTAPHMGPTDANDGWLSRSLLFRKNNDSSKNYRESGTTLFGRLMHDLVACETGLPPNTKVKIELDKASDEFVIMCPETDVNEKYKIKFLSIALFVPVAQLSASVFNEISAIMTRKNEPKTIAIHYRRIEVRPVMICKDKVEFNSDSLFNDADLPCRIIICFVNTTAKNGSYDTNPFDFQRSWDAVTLQQQIQVNDSERECRELKEELFDLRKRFEDFVTSVNETKKSKGKGRGKKSKPVNEPIPGPSRLSFEEQVRQEAMKRLREFVGQNPDLESGSSFLTDANRLSRFSARDSDLMTEDGSTRTPVLVPSNLQATTRKVFIEKISLMINQHPVDQLEDKETEEECMQAYWRMSAFNGQMNNQHTAGISYDDFRQFSFYNLHHEITNSLLLFHNFFNIFYRKGYFFGVYDLSTSGKCGTNYLIPSIRVGHLRLKYDLTYDNSMSVK
jgi:hypothetical protein